MLQLQPRENFTIVRQLQDHTDATTYYVRAVVRNSLTDAVIDTQNLTNRTNRRFTKVWQVPADVSGLGMYIDITTSVYTDSGYTTKSSNYGDENETYLVHDRTKGHGGGGMSEVINYKKLDKVFGDRLDKIKFPEYEAPVLDLAPVIAELGKVKKAVSEIEMPEQEKTDLTPVLEAIADTKLSIVKAVEAIDIPKLDLSPVLEAIAQGDFKEMVEMADQLNDVLVKLQEYMSKSIPEVKKDLEVITENVKDFVYSTATQKRPKEINNRGSKLL